MLNINLMDFKEFFENERWIIKQFKTKFLREVGVIY